MAQPTNEPGSGSPLTRSETIPGAELDAARQRLQPGRRVGGRVERIALADAHKARIARVILVVERVEQVDRDVDVVRFEDLDVVLQCQVDLAEREHALDTVLRAVQRSDDLLVDARPARLVEQLERGAAAERGQRRQLEAHLSPQELARASDHRGRGSDPTECPQQSSQSHHH